MALGDIQPHARYNPRAAQGTRTQVEKTLLSVVVLVLAGGLGFWAYRLPKTATRPRTYRHRVDLRCQPVYRGPRSHVYCLCSCF